MNKDYIIIILSFFIAMVFLTIDLAPNTSSAYENGVKCGIKYMLTESQKDVNFIVKKYSVSDSCAYIVENKLNYRGFN